MILEQVVQSHYDVYHNRKGVLTVHLACRTSWNQAQMQCFFEGRN